MVTKLEPKFVTAEDVAQIMDVSKSTGYRIIRQLNEELKKQGKIVVSGKVSKRYFEEKIYM